MTNNQHLIQANRLYMLIADLRNHEHYRHLRPVIGELIWGVLVHALSAADPSHENQPPDRFGNPHQAPAGADAFRQAIRRAPNLALGEARMEILPCLGTAQTASPLLQRQPLGQGTGHRYYGQCRVCYASALLRRRTNYALRIVGASGFTGRWLAYIDLPRRYHLADPNGFVTSK